MCENYDQLELMPGVQGWLRMKKLSQRYYVSSDDKEKRMSR